MTPHIIYGMSTIGSSEEFTVGFVTFRMFYKAIDFLSMLIFATVPTVIIDFLCFSTQSEGETYSKNNYTLTPVVFPVYTIVNNTSTEKNTILFRQQDPDTLLWSLHEIQIFVSANGARTTIWVEEIYTGQPAS